jgi:hypothetical protein
MNAASRTSYASAVVAASLFVAAPAARAFEPLFVPNSTPGILTGIAYAANPPPGLYFFNFAYGGESKVTGIGTAFGFDGFKVRSFHEVGAVLWTTPWQVLGASWMMVWVGGGVHATLITPTGRTAAHVTGLINPGYSPMSLSWNLGGGLFAKAGVFVWAPVGSIVPGPFINGLGSIGFPYWTLEGHFAVSYVADGWNLTASMIYGIPTENDFSGVTNGNWLNLDLTATRKFGQWEIGAVGYYSTQVTDDRGCEGFYGPGVCAYGSRAAIGGLVGYDFGALDMKLSFTHAVHTENSLDGWKIWTKLSVPLWRPAGPS